MKAVNLATNEELTFDNNTTPEYAVAYAYYCHQLNMASWFHACTQIAAEHGTTPRWMTREPMLYGDISVSLGDWAARTDGKE